MSSSSVVNMTVILGIKKTKSPFLKGQPVIEYYLKRKLSKKLICLEKNLKHFSNKHPIKECLWEVKP